MQLYSPSTEPLWRWGGTAASTSATNAAPLDALGAAALAPPLEGPAALVALGLEAPAALVALGLAAAGAAAEVAAGAVDAVLAFFAGLALVAVALRFVETSA